MKHDRSISRRGEEAVHLQPSVLGNWLAQVACAVEPQFEKRQHLGSDLVQSWLLPFIVFFLSSHSRKEKWPRKQIATYLSLLLHVLRPVSSAVLCSGHLDQSDPAPVPSSKPEHYRFATHIQLLAFHILGRTIDRRNLYGRRADECQ